MKKLQRIIALFLCIAMIVPGQGMPVYAGTADIVNEGAADVADNNSAEEEEIGNTEEAADNEASEVLAEEDDNRINEELPLETLEKEDDDRISETVPLESIEEEDGDRISETLPLDTIDDDRINGDFVLEALDDDFPFDEAVIYWNPGGTIPQASDYNNSDIDDGETTASASNAKSGRSSRQIAGLTPYKPVKTLKDALKKAEQIQEEGVDSGEITIYVMNPMEIKDGELCILNGGNIRLVSWPGRSYDNDSLFYINGGQLTLVNAVLESGNEEIDESDAELIYMRGGTLQMGQNVTVNGRIVMDYRSVVEELDWQEDKSKESNSIIIDKSTETETSEQEATETAEAETSEQEATETAEAETSEQEATETAEAETSEQELAETAEAETSAQEATETTETTESETSENQVTETSTQTESAEAEISEQEITESAEVNIEDNIAEFTGEGTDAVIVTTETTSGDTFTARVRKTDIKRIEFFNIDDYNFDTQEDNVEMIRDTKTASTWRVPIIELLDNFGSNNEKYFLDVRGDEETSQVELVKTLYADSHSEEEFTDLFTLVEASDESWDLTAYSEIAASVRDTYPEVSTFNHIGEDSNAVSENAEDIGDAEDIKDAEELNNGPGAIMAIPGAIMTQKTLIATRNTTGKTIYWNPGPSGTYEEGTYPVGDDKLYDGSLPEAPVKTWGKAVEKAEGGTIIAMNSVDLGNTTAGDYIPVQDDGSFLISSETPETIVTVRPWSSNIQPAVIVRENKTLVLKNVVLAGYIKNSIVAESDMIQNEKGSIIIDENVTAESGYIYVEAYPQIEKTPIKVTSTGSPYDGTIKLFYSEINENLYYRFRDVVVPSGDLKDSILTEADKITVGNALLNRMVLHSSHRDDIHGGTSRFDWMLRQDTAEDDTVANSENLELYTEYYYDAVYLDGVRGDDNNYGATCEYPVKTWAKAREIWYREMGKSISARNEAKAAGKTPEQIEERFPVPDVIYICGTVTVDSAEPVWELNDWPGDYDGSTVMTEVKPHTDIPNKDGSEDAVHEIPKVLVKVAAGGDLTIEDVLIRNMTDDKDSDTIQVEGGKLTFRGTTTLTGELQAKGAIAGKTSTYGEHVVVSDGGTFIMDDSWTGIIMRRQHGVTASGSGTGIIMNSGEIRENISYDKALYDAGDTNQMIGAGVVITDGAAFTMNGGKITENTVYQYGAGVYLSGENASFFMNKGEISNNKAAGKQVSYTDTTVLRGYGIGVYGGADSKIYIGDGATPAEQVIISGNVGYLVSGGGICSQGSLLKINQATVSNNFTNAIGYYDINNGVGIFAGSQTTVEMDNSKVINNYGSTNGYGNAYGAGIYLGSNANNYIRGSEISNNKVGRQYSTSYSYGGGIYAVGKLNIEETKIFGNQAVYGGGIYFNGTELNISESHVYSNNAKEFSSGNNGFGGGIYIVKGTVTLRDGTVIGGDNESEANWGYNSGGGIYQASGGTLNLDASGPGKIKISNNYTSYSTGYGGGIYSYGTLVMNNAEVSYNKANQSGVGGGIYSYGTLTIKNSVIKFNEANNGGGIYNYYRQADLYNSTLESNTAYENGGGFFGCYNSNFKDMTIKNNKAKNGGGIYVAAISNSSNLNYYLTDCFIIDNTAGVKGGGVYSGGYISGTSYVATKTYYTETADKKFRISGNTAENGGGIYTDIGIVYMDIAGPIKNTATTQGSNLYLSSANNWILQGEFLQPYAETEAAAGIYNIYVDVAYSDSAHSVYFDPVDVTIEKKSSVSDPDAIYLNTANSFLSYLREPPSNDLGTLPIDMNKENFKVGSIVIKYANEGQSAIFYRTKPDGIGSETYRKSYSPALTDAVVNVDYSTGHKLPRRTQFGGYNKNVVLIGEGVYLAGKESGGDDNHNGTSPDDAVATFKKAKEILETRINNAANDIKDKDGYSPFIYISGTVNVLTDEKWELDYTDTAKFASSAGAINQKYADAEIAAGDPVHDAQIRRFASFVNQPMIVIGNATNNADFETERIIINGMLEAVIVNDQTSNSPMLKIIKDSTATLTGYSRLTNNYYSGVDVYGSLILTGKEGEENRQLFNIDGYYAQMFASGSLEMNGYSRIIAEGDVERRGKINLYGVYSSAANVNILMKDHSSIVKDGNMILGGIMSTGTGTTIKMQDFSSIVNTEPGKMNSSYGAIHVTNGGTVEMENSSSIVYPDTGRYIGIYLSYDSKVVMRDTSIIKNPSYGLEASGQVDIQMQDFAEISNASNYGVYFLNNTYGSFSMNMNDDAKEGDSAKITGNNGINFYTRAEMNVYMGKNALIARKDSTRSGIGIYYYNNESGSNNEKIFHMKDNSRITGFDSGVYFYRYLSPVHYKMEDQAAIDANNKGIYEYESSTNYGSMQVNLEMSGKSRISGNTYYGIKLNGILPFEEGSGKYHKITLNGEAVIGGRSKFYNASDPTSGNGYTGIYVNSPLQMEMSGKSQIAWNGGNSNSDKTNTHGIYLSRYAVSSYYRAGASKITLSEKASINNNRGGVYAIAGNQSYPNPCEITLEGEASIKDNADAVYLMGTDQKLKLKDTSYLGKASLNDLSLDNYGSLILDGRSAIESLVKLRTLSNPITMTHEVTDPLREYQLWLAEGFLGKIVVQPDDPAGVSGGLTDVTGQFDYFKKIGAEGLANQQNLVKSAPNIILMGENNVYLSGNGNDNNDGNSPATAVRTFKQAKKLLETGYFTDGANILICNSIVYVAPKDTDWSFDSEGKVTNVQSGDRWAPKVIRYKDYSGQLIGLSDNIGNSANASEVTFKNIIIDGGSDEIILNAASGHEVLYIGRGTTAYLKEGAVLQKNKAVYDTGSFNNNTTMGVKVYGGTLEIDGGIIRNMVREGAKTNSSSRFSSAITCESVINYPAKLIMKSGQIVNNTLNLPKANSDTTLLGTIYLTGGDTQMVMSGGVIEDNKIITTNQMPRTGTILTYEAHIQLDGGIIRGNSSIRGSAIYYFNSTTGKGSLIISGGQITGNTTPDPSILQPQGIYSPVYIEGNDFQIKGGGADIKDNVYLSNTGNIVKVSGRISQTGRVYHLYLNQGFDTAQFKKGSAVVQPDGSYITDVSPYLKYFQIHSSEYILDMGHSLNPAGTVPGVTEDKCLILMKTVYLDSVKGLNTNNGSSPAKAVNTFTKAKEIGQSGYGSASHYVIYISGKAVNTMDEKTWSLPEPAYMCRYTGFPIYDSNGNETPEIKRAYYGHLIEPAYPLAMDHLTVYGRRTTDTTASNGDSILKINPGIAVIVGENVVFERNYNIGNYIAEDGIADNLSSKGGAVFVDAGGQLSMSAGSIQETESSYGSAIYLEASKTDPGVYGKLYLTGSPVITGKVYLNGESTATAAYIEPDSNYKPGQALGISVGNDYNGRPVISYRDGTVPGYDELKSYVFDDSIQGLYDIVNRAGEEKTMELSMRRAIYLDGKAGDDIGGDGLTPKTAFKTLKKVYESIGKNPGTNGVLVLVVDTVEISAATGNPADVELMNILVKETNGSSHYEGYYKDTDGTIDIIGQVYFKRYAQPDAYNLDKKAYEAFKKGTLEDTLFRVKDGGSFTISGIYIDGHSQDTIGSDVTLTAKGVEAQSPLITVEGTGVLKAARAEGVENGIATATLFTNNFNTNMKSKVIGELNQSEIWEGSGAGIELLEEGTAYLEYTEFKNLKLGENVIAGGTDVYSNGYLHFSLSTLFSGTVYLEGFGTADADQESSRYLTVDVYGTPALNDFQVLMRDSYKGRTVVVYEKGITATQKDAATFRLEERVKDFFYLSNRENYPHILELSVPVAVYIDGNAGIDEGEDRVAGSTPETPVRTLKRAYELLKTRGGNTIYVVNTIQISGTAQATGNSYQGSDGHVILGSTNKVNIVRYIQPDFARNDPSLADEKGYKVDDFTGVLLNVADGSSAEFSQNIFFDGHRKPKTGTDYRMEAVVSRTSEAKAPMITVEEGGTLKLNDGVTLQDNNNTYDAETESGTDFAVRDGGAIYNSGIATIDGALFTNNAAKKGSGVYQDGEFTILSAPEKLENHSFYLSTDNTGTKDAPVWGTDHVIQVGAMIPDNIGFEVDMDHAVKGRDVIRFTDSSAYNPNADAEHDHFRPGLTVPVDLFLVEDKMNPEVLELQNWEILDVEVPQDIYLVVKQRGSLENTVKLTAIRTDADGEDLFSSPEYTIKNKGIYDVKVFMESFANKNIAAGISDDPMNLLDSPYSLFNNKDMYLAMKGLDDGSAGSGFSFTETPLKPYAESTVTEAPVLLGALKSGTDGNFAFVGAFGPGFVEKYMDSTFPIEGDETIREKAQQYMDGGSDDGIVHARAKYEMKYRIEIDPSRRNLPR